MTAPFSREAEEAALGSVLINPNVYFDASRLVKPEDFFIQRHGTIWRVFETLVAARSPIDIVTVGDELASLGLLEQIGGRAYLTALTNQAPSSFNGEEYAKIVREHADRRIGMTMAQTLVQDAANETKPFNLNEHAMAMAQAARGQSKRIDPTGAAQEMIALISSPRCYTCGIADVDRMIGGLFPSELSILAGYQGTGKSAEKLQGARKNADAGRRVLLVDLEMTAAQTWFRMACGDLSIDVNRIRADRATDEEKARVVNRAGELGDKYQDRLIIYQAPMTPGDILSAAMMEQPDIIYIDTLRNIAGRSSKENIRDFYDNTLNFLRSNVAQQTGAHVQVLHHVNRESFKEKRAPTIHDLIFAGESDADAVFLLYREEGDYGTNTTKVPVHFIVGKSRFGWTGEETTTFALVEQKFYGTTLREDGAV